MAEGINMGRRSPWSKEEYISAYNRVGNYAYKLFSQLWIEEGPQSAAEAIIAYNFYRCPVVYLFIHYHYGVFEDLEMNGDETMAYLMTFLPNVRRIAEELKMAFATGKVFLNDPNHELASILIDMCDEIIYIEDNF